MFALAGWLAAARLLGAAGGTPPGTLDLRDWSPATGGPVRLDADWRLFPNELRDPAAAAGAATHFAHVPKTWDPRLVRAQGAPAGHGVATYALTVLLPDDPGPLALRVVTASTALRLFADGELVAAEGRVAATPAESAPAYRPQIAGLPASRGGRLELVLQISNFDYAKGGPWESIWIGPRAAVERTREAQIGLALFLGGAFTLVGFYHLTLWGARPGDRSPLLFSLVCLATAVRGTTVEEVYLVDLLPHLSFANLVRCEYGSLLVMIAANAGFVRVLFPAETPRALARSFSFPALAGLALVLLLPPAEFSRGLPFLQLLGIASAAAGTVILARAVAHRRDGAALFLVGIIAILLTGAHDVALSIFRELPTTPWLGSSIYLQPFGLLVYILAQAAVLAIRSSGAYEAIETTSRELRATHGALDQYARELESRVAERTAALESANRKLAHLAEIDGLTRVGNRRHFDEVLDRAWRDHARRGAPLSVLLVDVDAFKAYNDRHGHQAGDDALRAVGAVLAAAARRPGDDASRYGGEEFAAILPNTAADGARHVAEEVRAAVEAAGIPHDDSPVGAVVTASVGCATMVPALGSEPSALVERADRALYRAKQAGRNRVEADL